MRVLATHSIRQFPLHFPSHASPCAIRFQTHAISRLVIRGRWLRVRGSMAEVVGAELWLSEGTMDKWKSEALQLKISSVMQLYCVV